MTITKAFNSQIRSILIDNPQLFNKQFNSNFWHSISLIHHRQCIGDIFAIRKTEGREILLVALYNFITKEF